MGMPFMEMTIVWQKGLLMTAIEFWHGHASALMMLTIVLVELVQRKTHSVASCISIDPHHEINLIVVSYAKV
jgi:hypothetical protein